MQHGDYAGAPTGALAVPLKTRTGSVRAWVWIDEADYEWASGFNWSWHEGYAKRNMSWTETGGKNRRVLMHRELMKLPFGDKREVDHINRDGLDNRRSNLRVVTKKQNCQNQGCNPRKTGRSSKYRGVSLYKQTGRWLAYCRLDGKLHHLGYYAVEEDAAEAARAFRREHMPFSEDAAA